jgi:hypothetical protein
MKHKHAELIKAWADGAEIEFLSSQDNKWYLTKLPSWEVSKTYRIKPEEKQPVVRWLWAFKIRSGWVSTTNFYTDSEVVDTNPDRVKLEYTRTEFPE